MCQSDGDCSSDSYCYQPFGYCILKAEPLVGPEVPGQAFSACGGQSQSPQFFLHSATGQATPVGDGRSASANFVLLPGVLGGM
jgi:hypothetical protein